VTDPFTEVLILLFAGVVVVPLFQRAGIPSVLGYLAAGIALGPHTPGPVLVDLEGTRALAELGVAFLLFTIGLDLPLQRLRTLRRLIFGLGLLQVLVCGFAFASVAHLSGLGLAVAAIVGVTLAFSSTATVLAILVERGEVVTHHGRVAIAVLILQDLAVVPILVLMPLLAAHDAQGLPAALGEAAVKAVVAVGGIYLFGRGILRPAYRYISRVHNAEVFTAANLLLVLAMGWATREAGMSMALGTFLAGLLVADTPYRHQVEADIEPFRGLLLGLFFMTVGMSIDLPFVAANLVTVVGLTVAVLAGKCVLITVACLIAGLHPIQGLRIGLLLSQAGEFGFLVFSRGDDLGLLDHHVSQSLLATVAMSMVATPALAALGRDLTRRWRERRAGDLTPTAAEALSDHVIIAGYGRVGRTIARIIAEHKIPYVALDLDPDRVAKARAVGLPVYYGDAGQAGVLRSVGIERARAVVITVNRPRTAERAVAQIRQAVPTLTIIARAHDLSQKQVLAAAGASAVVPETIEASFQLAGLVMRSAGIAPEQIEQTLHRERARDGAPDPTAPRRDGAASFF